jgi:hypothetical protein
LAFQASWSSAGQHDIVGLQLREVGLHPVIVGLAERIELVIMASRAAYGDAQKRRANDVGHLGQHFVVGAGHVLISGILAQRTEPVESAGDQVGLVGRIHFVAGELLFDERVVRLVVIEAPDHVIAITPRIGTVRIVFITVGLREAHHVQPMAAPLFAIVGRGEQAIDHLFPRIGRFVIHEVIDFPKGWRQTREVEGDAANERSTVGGGRGRQTFFAKAGQNERVHRGLHPSSAGGVGKLRRRRILSRLKFPLTPFPGGVRPERRHRLISGNQQRGRSQDQDDALHATLLPPECGV